MHVGAAQALFVRVLAGRHLGQCDATQEDLGLILDEDVVVAHARLVGAAGRRCTEYDRDGRNPHFGELGDLVEQSPRLREVTLGPTSGGLGITTRSAAAQVRPGGLHKLHIGQAIRARDLESAHQFLGVEVVERPRPHAGVVPEDQALAPRDDADPHDEAGADREI